jgi:hypothetical protein
MQAVIDHSLNSKDSVTTHAHGHRFLCFSVSLQVPLQEIQTKASLKSHED